MVNERLRPGPKGAGPCRPGRPLRGRTHLVLDGRLCARADGLGSWRHGVRRGLRGVLGAVALWTTGSLRLAPRALRAKSPSMQATQASRIAFVRIKKLSAWERHDLAKWVSET